MVEFQPSKLAMRVQSPPPAPLSKKTQRSGAATEVAQTSKSAVSRVSKPASAATPRRLGNRRHGRFGNLRYGTALPRRKICAACENFVDNSYNEINAFHAC